jgi:hypothetical protein
MPHSKTKDVISNSRDMAILRQAGMLTDNTRTGRQLAKERGTCK